MTLPLPPPPTKKVSKNIIIAIAVIAIVLIALVAGVMMGLSANQSGNSSTPTPTSTPTATPTSNPTSSPSVVTYDFTMSADYPSFNITQGGSFTVSLNLNTKSGDPQTVNPSDISYSADSGTSGISCDFETANLGFASFMTITIPASTATNNYAITVTAKVGSVSHSISILVAVESSTVTISGTVNAGNSGITPYQIQFWNVESITPLKYYATLTGNTYSISVPNHQNYAVSVSDGRGTWYNCNANFWLQVPAGSTSMTKDFTVFGS